MFQVKIVVYNSECNLTIYSLDAAALQALPLTRKTSGFFFVATMDIKDIFNTLQLVQEIKRTKTNTF